LAEHVSFFSRCNNDLIQYTIAVDRVNERVAYLYEPTHPAVLKLIKMAVDAGHAKGIWVGVCGQMAADPVLAPLLVGMGVDELSVAPQAVPLVKDAVRSVSYAQSRQLAETVLQCRSGTEALRHCREMVREAAPEVLELI
jgi:phosphotransferase system enzyme I (PtsI)